MYYIQVAELGMRATLVVRFAAFYSQGGDRDGL